jgi:ferric-dicitrate binding protein FerR (iron transport regulator)
MDRDNFLLLVTRVLSGNDDAGEKELLQQQVAKHKELALLYEQYKRYWESGKSNAGADVEAALARTWSMIGAGEKMEEETEGTVYMPSRSMRVRWAAAAAVLVILLAGWWLFRTPQDASPQMMEAYNPKGIRSQIVLPDGSKVWLSADSRLRYPAVFAEGKRDIQLEGEAFFDVVQNPSRPFEVYLQKGSVRVLGTSFNIRSYKEDMLVTTSVATGKVAFRGDDKTISNELTTGRKAIYNKETQELELMDTDPLLDKGWIDGTLVFRSENLESVARTLERYYGKKIVFLDDKPRKFRFTGTFLNKSQTEILQYLSKTKPFSFTVSDSAILIGR